jgi:hypothetical protein
MVFGGYQNMGRTMIVAPRASWQRILIKISFQMSEITYRRPFNAQIPLVDQQGRQGDIFMLQLRGHFDFA